MATMTLLQIVQQFCKRRGLVVPTKVIESADEQITQIAALANEILEDLATRQSWEIAARTTTFTSVAAESQGTIASLTDANFVKIQNNTIWDRTLRLPVWGPLDPPEWQQIKALPVAGPLYRYRILGGELLIVPTMEAGHEMAFEYTSSGLVQAAGGGAVQEYFEADTDVFLLPASLMIQGLRWKWNAEKGLPYAENQRTFEASVAEAMGSNGTKRVIDMAGGQDEMVPGIWVPAGSINQ